MILEQVYVEENLNLIPPEAKYLKEKQEDLFLSCQDVNLFTCFFKFVNK